MQDPENQLKIFRRSVELLGGAMPTARYLKVSERQVRGLLSGERTLHDGFLRDTAAALLEHAEACRKLERQISPAFVGNLTEAQANGTANRGRRTDLEARRHRACISEEMRKTLIRAQANDRVPARWEMTASGMQELMRDLDLDGISASPTEFLGLPIEKDRLGTLAFKLVVEPRHG